MSGPCARWHVSFRGGPLDGTLLPVGERHVVHIDDPEQVASIVDAVLAEQATRPAGAEGYRWSGSRLVAAPGRELIVMVPRTT